MGTEWENIDKIEDPILLQSNAGGDDDILPQYCGLNIDGMWQPKFYCEGMPCLTDCSLSSMSQIEMHFAMTRVILLML